MPAHTDEAKDAQVLPSMFVISLLAGGALLFLSHLLHHYLLAVNGIYLRFFDLNEEVNLPALYSAMLWGLASFFSFRLAREPAMDAKVLWGFFCGVFGFLALDEYFRIHESLNDPLRSAFELSGALHFPWVIPYAVALLVVAPFGWLLIRSLPLRYSSGFIVSGGIYVFSAIVMEIMGAGRKASHGRNDVLYSISTTIEETLEILGTSLFLIILYRYIWSKFSNCRWRVDSALKFSIVMGVLAVLLGIWEVTMG